MNYYEVLGIRRGSSDVQIRQGFRRKCLENHPDRNGGSIDSLVRMKLINEAYGVLSDVVKRRNYDLVFESEEKRRVEEERVKRKDKIEREKKRKEEEEFARNAFKLFAYYLKKQEEYKRRVEEEKADRVKKERIGMLYYDFVFHLVVCPVILFLIDNLYFHSGTDWNLSKMFIWISSFGFYRFLLWLFGAWWVKY